MPQFFAVVGLPTTPRRKRHLPILDSIRLFCYCWEPSHLASSNESNLCFWRNFLARLRVLDSTPSARCVLQARPIILQHTCIRECIALYVAHANSPRRNRIESCQLHDIMTREPNKELPVGHRSCIPPPVYLRIESRNALRHRRGMFDAPLHPTFCLRRPHNLFSSQQTGK